MADVIPKLKLYILVSVISFIINLGAFSYKLMISNTLSVADLIIGVIDVGGSFVPFVSFVSFALMGLPIEVFLLLTTITTILSIIQSFIIAMIIISLAKNIIWQPDV